MNETSRARTVIDMDFVRMQSGPGNEREEVLVSYDPI
jgi:hypothetical protein